MFTLYLGQSIINCLNYSNCLFQNKAVNKTSSGMHIGSSPKKIELIYLRICKPQAGFLRKCFSVTQGMIIPIPDLQIYLFNTLF